jgi:hypothetical protein
MGVQTTKEEFSHGFGWVYGTALGIGLVAAGFGMDAWQLAGASAESVWLKPGIALVLLGPLSAAAGWMAGRAYPRVLVQCVVWIGWGIAGGFIVGHVPFELSSAAAGLADPIARGWQAFPSGAEAQFATGVAIVLGAVIAFPATLLQSLSTDWTWDRTTSEGRMTVNTWSLLLVPLVVGLGLGALDDSMVNATLRDARLLSNRVVQIALHTPADLSTSAMPPSEMLEYMAGMPWRGKLSERFTEYLADYDVTSYQLVSVDLVFDNGFVLRCKATQYSQYIAGCYDLDADYRALMPQFVETGRVDCQDCTANALPAATGWQSQHRGVFSDPKAISVEHHAGRIVVVGADFATGGHAQCYFLGAEPVLIAGCD